MPSRVELRRQFISTLQARLAIVREKDAISLIKQGYAGIVKLAALA
jgi:hypothetical protein